MKIIGRTDGPDNGDGSRWVKLRFEHQGKEGDWPKTVRLYPDTKLPWFDLKIRVWEAYRDITSDFTGRPELPEEHILEWFPELVGSRSILPLEQKVNVVTRLKQVVFPVLRRMATNVLHYISL
jgi:hypothetical protein